MQHLVQVLLLAETVQEQVQHPDNGLHPHVARCLKAAVSLPEAPDGSHATAHVPEGVYLWTWTTTKVHHLCLLDDTLEIRIYRRDVVTHTAV